jgi:hypothetical protein
MKPTKKIHPTPSAATDSFRPTEKESQTRAMNRDLRSPLRRNAAASPRRALRSCNSLSSILAPAIITKGFANFWRERSAIPALSCAVTNCVRCPRWSSSKFETNYNATICGVICGASGNFTNGRIPTKYVTRGTNLQKYGAAVEMLLEVIHNLLRYKNRQTNFASRIDHL